MTEHTKEPWFFEGDAIYDNADCVGDPVVHVMSCAYDNDLNNMDARRIVACVNACAEIETNVLEKLGFGTALKIPKNVRIIEQQRDQLLAALEVAEQFMVVAGDWNMSEAEINGEMRSTHDLLGIVRAAVAAVKGE